MELVKTEQPKPKFSLNDLEAKLTIIYNALMAKNQSGQLDPDTTTARSITQELIAIITRLNIDLDVIGAGVVENKTVQTIINTEKPQFHVYGVQLIENGQLTGTSLYSTIIKARKIRDILNTKFAELRVNHEAKIINYPVF